MPPLKSDGAVYSMCCRGTVIKITASYVGDSINAGNAVIKENLEITLRRFESKPYLDDNFDFNGVQIEIVNDVFSMSPRDNTIKPPTHATRRHLWSLRHARAVLSWVNHTQPGIACVVN